MLGAATVIRQECLEKAQPPWGGYGHAMGGTIHAMMNGPQTANDSSRGRGKPQHLGRGLHATLCKV